MYSEELEKLIEVSLSQGMMTDEKRAILMRRASDEGVNLAEFKMYLDSRVTQSNKETASKYAKMGGNVVSRILKGVLFLVLLIIGIYLATIPFWFRAYRRTLKKYWCAALNIPYNEEEEIKSSYVGKGTGDVERFIDKYQEMESGFTPWMKRIKYIQSFKVPYDKESLMLLLGFLEPKLKQGGDHREREALVDLYKKAVNIARAKHAGNPDFEYYLNVDTNYTLKDSLKKWMI